MDIQESLQRILKSTDRVADLFYQVFFERYPEVSQHFAGVDLQRQAVLLTMALELVVQYSLHSFPTIEAYLKILGQEHHRRGISPDLYPKFREALLATLGRFHGRDWDEQLARQWQEALELASDKMLAGYGNAPSG
jgi:hemoglobin-like flavoprotein